MFFSGKGRTMTGLMPNTAQQALQSFFPLEPDWLSKAAAIKLSHKGRATSAAFDSQAAHRIPIIAGAERRNENGETETHY
jgi:hypothetical protein